MCAQDKKKEVSNEVFSKPPEISRSFDRIQSLKPTKKDFAN